MTETDSWPLRRPTRGRVLAGVCVGIADHLGISVTAVRLAMSASALALGAGIVMYIYLAVSIPAISVRPTDPSGPDARLARPPQSHSNSLLRLVTDSGRGRLLILALVALLAAGAVLIFNLVDVIPWGTLLAAILILSGAGLAWSTGGTTDSVQGQIIRLGGGVSLMVIGVLTFLVRNEPLNVMAYSVMIGLVVLGIALLAAWPAAQRLVASLQAAQEERIRETERADLAAHLHDSVLQTLTLIRNRSDSPDEVTRLARVQERQLRSWLYTDRAASGTSLADALRTEVADIEDLYGTSVEFVVVGDMPPDSVTNVLISASREAIANAVRHGEPPVSVYLEVTESGADVFVRDHGSGVELESIPADRHGIRESIIGRLERHGGTAEFKRRDPGTEVHLHVAREGARHD